MSCTRHLLEWIKDEKINPTSGTNDEMIQPDFVEVGRQAHELESSHGRAAWQYAARLAKLAAQEEKFTEAAFWDAVAATLRPR